MFEMQDTSRKGYATPGGVDRWLGGDVILVDSDPSRGHRLVVRTEGSVRRLYARGHPLLSGVTVVRKWDRSVGQALSQSRLECNG